MTTQISNLLLTTRTQQEMLSLRSALLGAMLTVGTGWATLPHEVPTIPAPIVQVGEWLCKPNQGLADLQLSGQDMYNFRCREWATFYNVPVRLQR